MTLPRINSKMQKDTSAPFYNTEVQAPFATNIHLKAKQYTSLPRE